MSKKHDRHVQIRSLLSRNHKMKTVELAKELAVTPETLRKDLDELQRQGLLIREHGSVRLYNASYETPVGVRQLDHVEEKRAISYYAFKQIQDGQVVYLDSSSTVILGLENLLLKKDVTVVTNSLIIAQKCMQYDCDVLIAGGHVIKTGSRTYDYFATQLIDSLQIDVAIVGTEGLKDSKGITTSYSELGFKKHVIQQAKKVIVVCDSSKFEQTSSYVYGDYEAVDLLITTTLSSEQKEKLKEIKEIVEIEYQRK
ncbi:MAG: DeoR/GlpR transcriptional regulator [Erysipelotrichaceae bacterium]|nr:DeoR/GlpR transcriptional regulator [Erysipelotrichaceae bacterium]